MNLLAALLTVTLLPPFSSLPQERSPLSALAWPTPQREHRPGVYWWIPGSALDEENVTWNLETLREAGFGGMSMVLIYGVKGEEERTLEFLSPEWVEMFDHVAREAERLGLWLDLTPGGGWKLGGPEIDEARGEQLVAIEDGRLVPSFLASSVKRSGPGARGRAINPYSPRILREYLGKFDAVFARPAAPAPRAFYHDSFEYQGNWCDELPAAFRVRHGYDLSEHAAALSGEGDPDVAARVRHDYRETLADLHLESVATLVAWARGHGATVRQQAHGSPTNLLDAYALCGIPETEIFGAGEFAIPGLRRDAIDVRAETVEPLVNRLASSAAHLSGRRLVAAETCTWVRNHFRTALSQVKPEIDRLFLAGINHVFYHGCCYSPRDAAWPGWLFYAAWQCNPRNTLWRDVPALNEYVARCQSILQEGEPDADVLLYWPVHDLWNSTAGNLNLNLTVHRPEFLTETPCGDAARWLLAQGYSFDFTSDALLAGVRWEEGRLRAARATYAAVLVPAAKYMPAETLAHLQVLAAAGAPVLFLGGLPEDVPGWGRLDERRSRFARVDRSSFVVADSLGALLPRFGVRPEPMVAAGLEYARRRHAHGVHYFIANQGAKTVDAWIALARPAASVVVFDPLTGRAGVAPIRQEGGMARVRLQLAPGESRILRTFTAAQVAGPAWRRLLPAGEPRLLTGEWTVEFVDGGPKLPPSFTTTSLESWAARSDPEAQAFGGTARYRVVVVLGEEDARRWRLDLGDVRESARVRVNGRPVGTVFSHPFSLVVENVLRTGRNELEIEVTNLAANRIRDLDRRGIEWRIFHDINFVDHEYRKFDASGWGLVPSGLLGPVTLTPLREE